MGDCCIVAMKEKDRIIEPEVYEVSSNMKLQKHNAVMENALIEARYSLTVEEQRLILTTIAMLDNIETASNGFPTLKIPKKLIIETTGLHEKDYKVVKNSLERLMSRVITIETEKGFELYQWFAKAKYNKGDEYIEVQFHPDLKPYLLELKKRFTKIPLKQVLKLRSKYAIRLYELLKRYEDTGFRTDYLPELRKKLGVEEKEYKAFKDFEKRVLKPAVKEINEKTDLEVSYTKKKTGRRITHIDFKVKSKYAKEGYPKETKKSFSISLDIQRQKNGDVVDLWETVLIVLENVYKVDPGEIDILREYIEPVYKTNVKPKLIVLKPTIEGEAKRRLCKLIKKKYWKRIKELVQIESNGNYEVKISKEFM